MLTALATWTLLTLPASAPLPQEPISTDQAPRPNILLIVADDMGYGDLSCYGSKQIATPNLDALAESGVRCTDGYVSGCVCAPSRAGMITGRYQERFGFDHNLSVPEHVRPEWAGLPQDEITIADRLKKAGYATALIGKWHLGESVPEQWPNQRGFDHFFGMRKGSHGYFPTPKKNQLYRNGEKVTEIDEPYLTDWFTSSAIEWFSAERDEPWFCMLSYNTPHTPMQARDDDLALFKDIEPKRRRIYCAMQHRLDLSVGRVVEALEKNGQRDNTLIVFLSDNGGSVGSSSAINAPLNGQKGCFLEGGLRVPMIFSWPRMLPGSTVYREPVIALDFAPTFVNLAGGSIAPWQVGKKQRRFDGVDLVPFLRGDQQGRPHDVLFWRISLRGAAIREGDLKLIRVPFRGPMLFDLSTDLSEQNDLARERPDEVDRLMRRIHDWERSFERNPLFESAVRWSTYNRKLYEREYELAQPDR